ncbi:hypothetical protein BS47DRAFT_439321 [Hydnum rufescens UP504]|uniref:Uncharacterized protein n=1 Tax=Hydnum rufescens UP504 TaxID=1448309 RepID=A0A9P6B5L9_9AGAM|nr:hypothetical protein BS47DRAFT_439321 [Hydnum rufescens UP504]
MAQGCSLASGHRSRMSIQSLTMGLSFFFLFSVDLFQETQASYEHYPVLHLHHPIISSIDWPRFPQDSVHSSCHHRRYGQ